MNRVRKRFVTKPLALALSVVFLLTNAGGGVTTLSSVLAAAASLALFLANTISAYATQLHLHANYTLATAVMAAQVLPPASDDGDAAGSGSGHSWQASVAGINAVSRAKQTDIPLVSWRARGGLPVSFSLHHNSKAAFTNPAIGAKWSHTYDTHLDVYPQQNRAAVVWGHHTLQLFDLQGGQWVPRDGYRDRLSAWGNGYALTLKSQVRLEFEPTNLINHYRLSRIVDPNGNAIVLTYDSNGLLTQVSDPSGRAIQLQYTGNKLTGVRFAVGEWNRTWTLQYDASGRLQRVYYPLVSTDTGVQSYFVEFGYTGRNNISSFTDCGGNLCAGQGDAVWV